VRNKEVLERISHSLDEILLILKKNEKNKTIKIDYPYYVQTSYPVYFHKELK
jgi:hypothetical protein